MFVLPASLWLTSWSFHLWFCRVWNAQGTHLRGTIPRSVRPPFHTYSHSPTYTLSHSHTHTTHTDVYIQTHTYTHELSDHLPHTPTHTHSHSHTHLYTYYEKRAKHFFQQNIHFCDCIEKVTLFCNPHGGVIRESLLSSLIFSSRASRMIL